MRFSNLAAALVGGLLFCVAAANAQSDTSGVPLPPRAVPLPPPGGLKPDASVDIDNPDANVASMPQDTPILRNGIEAVCTGIGSAKNDPRWKAYPVRIEFADSTGRDISGLRVTLEAQGQPTTRFVCWAPWVLVRASAGDTVRVSAQLVGNRDLPVRGATFTVPSSGQKRVVIALPSLGPKQ